RVDILIFLRRVFRVLDRSVGTLLKPFVMLLDIRMIGRRLERDVHRHINAVLRSARYEPAEIVEGAEAGVNCGVAAFGAADRPRAADVTRLRADAIVAALAKCRTDRMNRREIEHVESHPRDARQMALDVCERAVLSRRRRGGTREQLVPRAER